MKTIAVGGFLHESNSFAPSQDVDCSWFARHRDRPPLLRGAEVVEQLAGASFSMTGFLSHMAARPHRLAPLVWASGGAGGLVRDDGFERIVGELTGRLSLAMPVDALYLDLHGAMVTPHYQDPEGELLRRVRSIVGGQVPIVITLDYHANVSPEMAEPVDDRTIAGPGPRSRRCDPAPALPYPATGAVHAGGAFTHAHSSAL